MDVFGDFLAEMIVHCFVIELQVFETFRKPLLEINFRLFWLAGNGSFLLRELQGGGQLIICFDR